MARPRSGDYSDQGEARATRNLAARLNIRLDREARHSAEANFVGIRSERVLFSRRTDSRTYLVHRNDFGLGSALGAFEGNDKALYDRGRVIMKALGIPTSERGQQTVIAERHQAAEVAGESGEIRMGEVERGGRFATIQRDIGGLQVWSSRFVLALAKDGQIGFMELHWPEIPSPLLEEARRLQHMVKRRWKPPSYRNGKVESVEPGIIHSPALSFVMDIYPAIRVIYGSTSKGRAGKKAALYLDRHGKPVPIPRVGEMPYEERLERSRS